MNLANDLDATGDVMEAEKTTDLHVTRDMGDYLPHRMRPDQPLQDIIDRIRVSLRHARRPPRPRRNFMLR